MTHERIHMTTVKKEIIIEFEREFYNERIQSLLAPTLAKFKRILRNYTLFNAFFCCMIVLETLYLVFHFAFLTQSFMFALYLALIFATVFSFVTLRLYLQTKKTEQCLVLKNQFVQSCKQAIQYQEDLPDSSLTVASACCKLASDLEGMEYHLFILPTWLNFFAVSVEKINCWAYWKDIHLMKELLLSASIEEHIKMIHVEPTNLEFHAGLANAYVMLSGLYVDPRTVEGLDEENWIPKNKYQGDFQHQFRLASERAVEEFKILRDYAPNDPWVHTQLAYSYRDLGMLKEEIQEYEAILQLCPDDQDNLFKLGQLYFAQGWDAKGLQIYEKLKKAHYKKAEQLIQFYGSFQYRPLLNK